MRRPMFLTALCVVTVALLGMQVLGQGGPPKQGGGGAGQDTGGGGGPGGGGGAGPGGPPPGGFHLLPRQVMEKLKLTPDQMKQVADLEKETKAKLDAILTPEQKKTLEDSRPPRRGPGGQVGPGGQGGGGGAPGAGPGDEGGDQGGQGGGGQGHQPPPPPPAK